MNLFKVVVIILISNSLVFSNGNWTKNEVAFLSAVKENNIKLVEKYIKEGININLRDKWGNTPLIISTGRGFAEMTQLLLKNNADVNLKIKKVEALSVYDGCDAFYGAVKQKHEEIAILLVKNNYDLGNRNKNGDTALMLACSENMQKLTQMLLKKGVDVNEKNDFGITALMHAVVRNYYEIASILLNNNADVKPKITKGKYKGYDAVDLAKMNKNQAMIDLLKQKLK